MLDHDIAPVYQSNCIDVPPTNEYRIAVKESLVRQDLKVNGNSEMAEIFEDLLRHVKEFEEGAIKKEVYAGKVKDLRKRLAKIPFYLVNEEDGKLIDMFRRSIKESER